ncbi:unnamed protein product [Fraxinus pennsylvanica]|uniref:Protein TIC 20 n=1 Tax=Fraxinus pennsylvanica TaxID=56036 RepID=A0AAD1YQ26_9LAMI|nr:unnamed protein product [Fraxinus pennsylvanica]
MSESPKMNMAGTIALLLSLAPGANASSSLGIAQLFNNATSTVYNRKLKSVPQYDSQWILSALFWCNFYVLQVSSIRHLAMLMQDKFMETSSEFKKTKCYRLSTASTPPFNREKGLPSIGTHFWLATAIAYLFTILECYRCALAGMYADVPFLCDAAYIQIPYN